MLELLGRVMHILKNLVFLGLSVGILLYITAMVSSSEQVCSVKCVSNGIVVYEGISRGVIHRGGAGYSFLEYETGRPVNLGVTCTITEILGTEGE